MGHGRVDEFLIFQVHFFIIEFHFTFSFFIKYYHIMFIIIVFLFGNDRPAGLIFCARFTSFHTHASLLTFFFCFFILFHSCCSHARVFGKPLVHEFPMSYSHTECYLFFSASAAASAQWESCAIWWKYGHASKLEQNWNSRSTTLKCVGDNGQSQLDLYTSLPPSVDRPLMWATSVPLLKYSW